MKTCFLRRVPSDVEMRDEEKIIAEVLIKITVGLRSCSILLAKNAFSFYRALSLCLLLRAEDAFRIPPHHISAPESFASFFFLFFVDSKRNFNQNLILII